MDNKSERSIEAPAPVETKNEPIEAKPKQKQYNKKNKFRKKNPKPNVSNGALDSTNLDKIAERVILMINKTNDAKEKPSNFQSQKSTIPCRYNPCTRQGCLYLHSDNRNVNQCNVGPRKTNPGRARDYDHKVIPTKYNNNSDIIHQIIDLLQSNSSVLEIVNSLHKYGITHPRQLDDTLRYLIDNEMSLLFKFRHVLNILSNIEKTEEYNQKYDRVKKIISFENELKYIQMCSQLLPKNVDKNNIKSIFDVDELFFDDIQ